LARSAKELSTMSETLLKIVKRFKLVPEEHD
jgi:hypothetical protein